MCDMNEKVVKHPGNPNFDTVAERSPPLVTYLLVTFDQEAYVREAILSAFSQTYSNLEILISDDRSTDNTFTIINEVVASYGGQHRVIVRRSASNNGLASHLNGAMQDAGGVYIIVAAGDDISLPWRTADSALAGRPLPRRASSSRRGRGTAPCSPAPAPPRGSGAA